MNEVGTRTDTLRHNAGQCPACREYLWAEVTIESKTSAPKLNVEGKATAYVNARPVGMRLTHECMAGADEGDARE